MHARPWRERIEIERPSNRTCIRAPSHFTSNAHSPLGAARVQASIGDKARDLFTAG
jgi:hypothetical protein